MRNRAARPVPAPGNPYKGFQNFPSPTTPKPPRPDRGSAPIEATAFARFTRSTARGPVPAAPSETPPYAGGLSA